jgi:nucleotide-binding universal stress UspA family protein
MFKKIVLAHDGSTFSALALKQAAELAHLHDAELHLIGIARLSSGVAIAESVGFIDVWGEDYAELEAILQRAETDLRNEGLSVASVIRSGEPAVEIAAYAHEIGANLIVLGHTGKGGLARWLQGSVGAKLLEQLPCSLLISTSGSTTS